MDKLYVDEFAPSADNTRPLQKILLVHGGASSNRMYADVIPLLNERGYHLLLPDLPGHGRTRLAAVTEEKRVFSFSGAVSGLADLIQESQASLPGHLTAVGISLGGQVVLELLSKHPELVQSAIVSGASVHPPDEEAAWEVPRLPLDNPRWMKILQEDVELMGMENAQAVQEQSFGFTFDSATDENRSFPPTLVLVGENDVAMAQRDFADLVLKLKKRNGRSSGRRLAGAWHNHSIDVPELFATVVDAWVRGLGE